MFLPVALTGTGDLIAAQAGKVIVVEAVFLVAGAAVGLTFQSAPAGGGAATNLTGNMILATPFVMNIDSVQMGLFQTNSGEGLRLLMSAGTATAGFIRYSLRG